jgi:hypothetical protein
MVPLAGLEPATPSLRIIGNTFPCSLPQFRVVQFLIDISDIGDTTFP